MGSHSITRSYGLVSISVAQAPSSAPITDDYRRREASAIRPYQYNLIFQNLKLPTESRVRVTTRSTARSVVELKYHYQRECVEDGHLLYIQVGTKDNTADLMTKPVETATYNHLAPRLKGMASL